MTRLIYLNLARQFPALVAYLVFLAVINLALGGLDPVSPFYFRSYIVFELLKWGFSLFAVRELFALTFKSYPGIRTVGRWAMYSGVVLALSISLLLAARLFWTGVGGRSANLFYFEASHRSVVLILAFAIVTILRFLSRYPLHLSRNTLVSSIFFSVLFLSEAVRLLIDSIAPRLFNPHADWAQGGVVCLCLIGWAVMLKPETGTEPPRMRPSTPEEDHLLEQLDALNQMMTRSARR